MPDIKVKYRPKKFKTFLGNDETVETIKELLDAGKLPHCILLTGPRGCGKTTLGRIIRKELNCGDGDYKELDTAVFRGIGTVRDLRDTLVYSPKNGDCKVYLIDEVHMLGKGGSSEKNEAQNAILKSLEEPPDYVYWILCTTNPEMLLPTIRSRSTEFRVGPLDLKGTTKLVKRVAKGEKKEVSKPVIKKLHKVSYGMPRDSLTLLGKIINLKSDKKKIKTLKAENLEENAEIIELCRALMAEGSDWDACRKILKSLAKQDILPEDIRRAVMGYANTVLINGNEQGSYILGWFVYKPTYDAGWPMITQFSYNVCKRIEPPC